MRVTILSSVMRIVSMAIGVVGAMAGCSEFAANDTPGGDGGARSDGSPSALDAATESSAGDAGQGGADGGPSLPCGGACTHGTTCSEFGWCKIDVAPTCAAPIEVTAAGGEFKGTICADGGTAMLCNSTMPAHVFAMGPADGGFGVVLGPDRAISFGTNVVDSSCNESPGSGCDTIGAGGGNKGAKDARAGWKYAIGAAADAGCFDYLVTFTPK